MKLSEVQPLLVSVFGEGGVSYRAFPESAAAYCPFAVWEITPSQNFFASNEVCAEISGVEIMIVSAAVDTITENALETALAAKDQPWQKSAPEYDAAEKVYITSYSFEVINDG